MSNHIISIHTQEKKRRYSRKIIRKDAMRHLLRYRTYKEIANITGVSFSKVENLAHKYKLQSIYKAGHSPNKIGDTVVMYAMEFGVDEACLAFNKRKDTIMATLNNWKYQKGFDWKKNALI